jgi:hypothetical protein
MVRHGVQNAIMGHGVQNAIVRHRFQNVIVRHGVPPVVKFSVGLSEYSFHAQELDSTEKFVLIPLVNKDKAKYSCGLRPACADTEKFYTT